MKRNFTNENFEDFLRQSADGLRMRPSDKVWKGISKHLNKRRRRIGFAIGSFLLVISTLGYFIVQDSANKLNSFVKEGSANTFTKTTKNSENQSTAQSSIQKTQVSNPVFTTQPGVKNNFNSINNSISQLAQLNADETEEVTDNNTPPGNNTEFFPTIVDSYFDDFREEATTKQQTAADQSLYPMTIESVVNSYKVKGQKKKLGFQFYFTPTISYRKLGENKSFLRSQSASSPNYLPALVFDVNNVVTHKPDIGFELGMAAKYPITRKMKLRGGLQFNVNRYDIKAYNAATSVATIMFNGRTSNRADSLNTYARYSNRNTGYKTNWLQNLYFQISAPVGVEFKVSGDEKLQFGVATTIQPTYVLGDRAYLISTDYKNYVEVPQLVRRWNVNTALETYVGYSTGRLDWQVGPQVRYQLLSSFINKYPVKENLFDFGLKVGISVKK
jgi:hypothetical protein